MGAGWMYPGDPGVPLASKPGLKMATSAALRLAKVIPSSNNVASPVAMDSKTNSPEDDSGVNSMW